MTTAVQGVVMLSATSETWVGHWPSTSAVVGLAAVFGSSISAAAAAWVAATPRHLDFVDLLATASRPPARVYAAGLASVVMGSATGYFLVTAYATVMTAPLATHGRLNLWEVAPLFATVPLAAAVGFLAGRVLPPLMAPVVAAAALYAANILVHLVDMSTSTRFASELVPYDETDRNYLAVATELLALKATVGIAVGVALLAFLLGARPVSWGAAVLGSAALAGVLLIAGAREDVVDAYEAICTESAPIACVDRAHDHLLDDYQAMLGDQLDQLPGLDTTRVRFVQDPYLRQRSAAITGKTLDWSTDTLVVAPISKRNTEPAHQLDARRFTAEFGRSLFHAHCVPAGESLYLWWLDVNGLPSDGSNFPGEGPVDSLVAHDTELAQAYAQFLALTPRERKAWFAEHGAQLLACAHTAADSE
ncbi:hypothetical protein [Nocardioides limicola]|uniref:hypothetical protein n=1 Tax=Nocardioides limicola TaxID=2803368 RepID=UPI00193C8388|nr:hypothetical protein [Nocardioides sp. DJM-14]